MDILAEESGIDVAILKEIFKRPNIVIKTEPECGPPLEIPDREDEVPEKPSRKTIKKLHDSKPENLQLTNVPELRPRRKRFKKQCTYRTNPTGEPRYDCRDRALSIIDLDNYHGNIVTDDDINRLIKLSKNIRRSQICSFTHDSRIFFVAVWLTTSRIFEYNSKRNLYFEAKRIPRRYVDIHRDLITSIHFCDSRFYIAYISRQSNATAYVEVRNLSSKRLSKPYHYDQIISSIESDKDFIYVKTIGNIIHIHNKNHFKLLHYRADFGPITRSAIINSRAIKISSKEVTKFELRSATESCFIVSKVTAVDHAVKQIYNLDPLYKTIAAHFLNDAIILHRNLTEPCNETLPRSKIDVGMLTNSEKPGYIVHERCVSFGDEIIQLEIGEDKVFLFGCSSGRYEIGCLNLWDFRPIWCASLFNVDHDCKMIVQENHVILLKSNQESFVLKVDDYISNDGILSDMKVEINSNM